MSIDVSFTDASTPGPSGPITAWAWDFGDTGTSAVQNPIHTYAADGSYTVQLTVTGTAPDGTDNITRSVQVGTGGVLQSSFTSSTVGLAVTFTDTSVPGPSGPITAWAWDFGDGGTSTSQNPSHTFTAGTYTVTLIVAGTAPDGTSTATNSVSVGGTNFVSVTSWPRPSFTPTRTVSFTTKAGLDAAISGMQAGDLIKYTGTGVLTISSASANGYNILNKNPASPVVIDFGCSHNIWDPSKITSNYVAFRYTGTSSWAAFYFNNLSNIRIYGGDYSTGVSGGTGFGGPIGNTHNCYFWDLYVHDCGTQATGFFSADGFSGANSIINANNVRAECVNWGNDLAADSHTLAPGTGLHACNTADNGGAVTNNTFTIYGHNPAAVGCCFEIGSQLVKGSGLIANNTIYVKAEHFHFHSTQTASNAINLWGTKDLHTNTVGWIEGNDLYGTVMHSTGQPNTSGMVVSHGRHSSTNQNPSDGIHVPYPTGWGIVYNDCT